VAALKHSSQTLHPETLVYGIGFDASNYGFAPVENSDMVFIPDIQTAVYDPFTQVATLSMIGDVFVIAQPQNYRFDQDPRTIARKAEAFMQETGIADEIRLGPEYDSTFLTISVTRSLQINGFFHRRRASRMEQR
jgi:glutamine synthetase